MLPILFGFMVAACGPGQPWHTTDVGGRLPPLEFTLTDTSGRVRHGAEWRGKIVLLFTGFTHCPGVCPATLARLATMLEDVEGSRENIRVLFVSLDPERDTPEILEAYVRRFGPWFVGLTGTREQLDALVRRYFLSYRKQESAGSYDIVHSDIVLVFDREGKARLLVHGTTPLADLKADLTRLLEE